MFHFLVCWPGFEKKKIKWFVYVSTYQGLACRAFKQSFFFLFIFFSGECCCVLVYTRYKEYWKKPPRNFLFFKKIGTWSPDVFFFPIIRKGINAVLTLFSESFFFCYWLSFGESVVLKILGVWPLLHWTNQLLTSCFKFSLGTWKFRISNSELLNVKACLHMR